VAVADSTQLQHKRSKKHNNNSNKTEKKALESVFRFELHMTVRFGLTKRCSFTRVSGTLSLRSSGLGQN
jgi:hypothetical protein